MTRRTILMSAAALVAVAGFGAVSAQQRAGTGLPSVTVFKSPT